MRIIGGSLRGKQIVPVKGLSARPTTDFAKEGLFNILSNSYDFEEISFLDLFSGTGSISFEMASRGCTNITAVEMNNLHSSFIKKSAADYKFEGFNVVRHNVFDFIEICRLSYDIIFADPPYDLDKLELLPDKILNGSILKEGGLFILEHSGSYSFDNHPNFLRCKKYGNVHFSFFE